MISRPVLIVGAPRSGTSLAQKILRNHPAFWSMPSESDIIWDEFCHPKLRDWDSEYMEESQMTPEIRTRILERFERLVLPSQTWGPIERANLIWTFRRWPPLRKAMRSIFEHTVPIFQKIAARGRPKRIIDKTASNSLRMGFVNEVFPDARIVYPMRDGRNSVNSLINGWLHPTRFFLYDVPVPLRIPGYSHTQWKFMLPPGWRDYVDRPLEEVCAFQWRSCNELMLAEIAKPKYAGRVFKLRLEELVAEPETKLRELADFIELPYDDYFRTLAAELPVVNSPDNDTSPTKWQGEHREAIERILPSIAPTMRRLGYEV